MKCKLERSRTRESALRVTFGLNVRVKALRDVNAELNGVKLKAAHRSMRLWKTRLFSTMTANWI